MAAVSVSGPARQPFSSSWGARLIALALVIYAVYAFGQLGFSGERFIKGLDNGARFLSRMFPPHCSDWDQLIKGFIESMEIAVLATFFGVLLSLPIAILGARNLMPAWATWPARLIVTLCRAFNPVIVAIIFIKAVGFGALAGVLALVIASIGFVGKLFMEAIEEISMKQIEAVRATGAPFASVVIFGVIPQVLPLWISYSLYRFESNVRSATVVGMVGAGGIGVILWEAIRGFLFAQTCALLIVIILVVSAIDILSQRLRKLFI